MENRLRRHKAGGKRLAERIERAAGDLNAMLLVVAIGLAALDGTCFFLLQMRHVLEAAGRTAMDTPAAAARPDGTMGAAAVPGRGTAAVVAR